MIYINKEAHFLLCGKNSRHSHAMPDQVQRHKGFKLILYSVMTLNVIYLALRDGVF